MTETLKGDYSGGLHEGLFNPQFCRGCENLTTKDQRDFETPERIQKKPFCRAYGLHIEWVKQIVTDDKGRCFRYE